MQNRQAEEALAVVQRLEEAGFLGTGGRLPALLRYLVQEECAGRGDRLKAYAIATTVLGRNGNFDPQQDSIVRVEIGRLRRALDFYYAQTRTAEPLRITIPRGTYRPLISTDDAREPTPIPDPVRAEAPVLPLSGARKWPSLPVLSALVLLAAVGLIFTVLALWSPQQDAAKKPPAYSGATPTLVILPITTDEADADSRVLALGLRSQLAAELGQQSWLAVSISDVFVAQEPVAPKLFTLKATLSREGNRFVLTAHLGSAADQKLVWSGRYENQLLHKPLLDLANGLAGELARDLGYPLGPVGTAISARSGETEPEVEDRFFCMMNAHRYRSGLESKQRADAITCLQRLTSRFPDFGEGRALLALFWLEDLKSLDGEARAKHLLHVEGLLRGASEEDRLALDANMVLSACKGEIDKTRALARKLFALAPNDPEILSEISSRTGLAALDWDFALEMEARAFRLSSSPTPRYGHAAAAKAVMAGDFETALRAMSRAPQGNLVVGQAMLFIIATLADAPLRAEGAAAVLAAHSVAGIGDLKDMIEHACWHEDVKAAFRRALTQIASRK